MVIAAAQRKEIIEDYRRNDADTGSPEVQVAMLTARIRDLGEHLKGHRHDFSSRRGLVLMVGKRNRLLKYLGRIDRDVYQSLIKRLGLRK